MWLPRTVTFYSTWKPPGMVAPVLVAAVCIAVGAAIYRTIEVPFMAFRARRFPSTFEPTLTKSVCHTNTQVDTVRGN
jgi:peptidoglycan/LPS O-acetylase OafA/YrhL